MKVRMTSSEIPALASFWMSSLVTWAVRGEARRQTIARAQEVLFINASRVRCFSVETRS
jgi:hypothetical protein